MDCERLSSVQIRFLMHQYAIQVPTKDIGMFHFILIFAQFFFSLTWLS